MKMILGFTGGLALFLYGMNLMIENLQRSAGDRMKRILEFMTGNPLLGVIAGAITSAVLQSSGAITVMLIGFVSAGLITLPQAISVIMGANIGTTLTAQLLAFHMGDYIWGIIFLGFLIYFISEKEGVRSLGGAILGFGFLFVGIEKMEQVMEPLAASPVFADMIRKVADIPVLGLLTGTLMTMVVQSSNATIAVLQNLASQAGPDGVTSIIGLAGAIPIMMGDNIGTTITAILASIGQSADAKRTAVAHSVLNITGSLLFLLIIPWFTKIVEYVSPKGPEIKIISRQIANAHTIFNFVCTILWLPFIWLMVKIVNRLIADEQ